jgi:TonB-linked SusC/RagA family outer membrane protein
MMSIVPVIWDDGPFQGDTHFWEDGDWGSTGIAPRLGNGQNYRSDRTRDKDDKWQDLRILGNVYADLKIIEGLNLRTSIGGSINNQYQTNWSGSTYEHSENVATPTYREDGRIGGFWTWTNTLTFNRQFGDHSILAVAGYEANKLGMGRGVWARGAGYYTEDAFSYRTVGTAEALHSGNSYFNTPRTLISQFLRPSVSAGWRMSEESFMAGVSWISDMKIRGGYGTMGNQLAVSTSNQFYLYSGAPDRSFYDIYGSYTSSAPGFRPSRIGNPDAKWETNITTNVGFDAVLFDRKLELVFDWYSKQNVDLLYNPELPATAGNASQPYVNVGEMLNTGIDLMLMYRQISGDFSFEVMGTLTTVNNEIISIAPGIDFFGSVQSGGNRIGATSRNEVGYPVGSFFGYDFQGFFMDQGDVDSHATQPGAEPGFLKYKDTDGSGEIGPGDRIHIGNPNPDFTYSLNLNLEYKGFDLVVFFYGSQGNEILNQNKWWLDFWPSFIGQKSNEMLYNSWTPTNTGADLPKASNKANFSTSQEFSGYYIEDGSFFRLKNLQIGYTFDRSVIGNVFSNLRIYIQGTNLFTLTKYTGLDPELYQPNETVFGVDQGNLPVAKQFIIGASLGF